MIMNSMNPIKQKQQFYTLVRINDLPFDRIDGVLLFVVVVVTVCLSLLFLSSPNSTLLQANALFGSLQNPN